MRASVGCRFLTHLIFEIQKQFSLYANLRREEDIPTYRSLSLSVRFYFMQILFNGALANAPYRFLRMKNELSN